METALRSTHATRASKSSYECESHRVLLEKSDRAVVIDIYFDNTYMGQ